MGAYSWVMTGDRNASSDMLSAANEGFMEGLSDGAAGVGDGLTTIPGTNISLTREARKALDINYIYDPEVYVLANYAGEFAQYVIIFALTAQEKPQLSSNNVAESVTKNGKTVGNLSDAVPNGKSIPAKPITNRPQHGSAAHNQKMLDEAQRMLDSKYTDVRTNQQLVNTRGNKVSNVRPDVQGTNPITGKRDVIEIQSPT